MKKLLLLLCLILLLTACNQEPELNGVQISNKEFIVGGEKVTVGGGGGERMIVSGASGIGGVGTDLSNFVPEVKLEKWGDETYIRIWLEEAGDDFATDVNGKIVWHNEDKSKEYNFYSLAPTEQFEDGGFEYEIILNKKPKSNVITLKIETKDLVFYYQPELTQEEIDRGDIRPENIVGSYAVYHATKKNHILGQTNYMAGKAFHIYRPQMEDAVGTQVWGELHIDEQAGILSVTIPQDFLDKAVYPIKHATGLTFGYTGLAGTNSTASGNQLKGGSGTGAAGTVTKVTAWLQGITSTRNAKAVIVEASGKTIISNGISDSTSIPTTKTQYDFTFSSNPTVSAQLYYPSFVADDTTRYFTDSGQSSGNYWFVDNFNSYNSPTDPTGGSAFDTYRVSIYATYELAGPSDTCTPPASDDWTVNLGDDCYVTTDTYVTGNLILIDNLGSGCLNIIDGATLAVTGWEATSTRDYICLESDDGSELKIWTPV